MMRSFGYFTIFIGLCYLLFAFNMDVSVDSVYGSVANIELLSRRQNHLIVACLVTLIGVVMAIFGPRDAESNSKNEADSDAPKKVAWFDGERDLSTDAYRLWLADAYSIKRNEIFDRFVVGETTFEDLDAALEHADNLESQKDAEESEAEERCLMEIEERKVRAEAEWQSFKPKMIAVATIFTIAIVMVFYFFS